MYTLNLETRPANNLRCLDTTRPARFWILKTSWLYPTRPVRNGSCRGSGHLDPREKLSRSAGLTRGSGPRVDAFKRLLVIFIRAKRVSNCYIPKKKPANCTSCVRSTNIGFSVGYACVRLTLVLVWGTYYVPHMYVPGISRQKSHHVRSIAW